MFINLFKSLRQTLFIWTFVFSLLPLYFFSNYLIGEFHHIQINEQIEKLELQNLNVAQSVEFELQLLTSDLIQTSQDADVILSAYIGVFGQKAREKLNRLTSRNSLFSAVMLIDKSGWIAEASPSKAELIDVSVLLSEIDKLSKDQSTVPQYIVKIIKSSQLSNSLRNKASIHNEIYQGKTPSDHILLYISPLIFTDSETLNTGYLVGLVPMERVFDNWQAKLSNSQLIDLSLENESIVSRDAGLAVSDEAEIIAVKTNIVINKITASNRELTSDLVENKKHLILHANVERDKANALQKVRTVIEKFNFLTVFILIIIIVVNVYIIQKILNPLSKLSQVITEYANGNLHPERPELFFNEISQIIDVLAEMAKRIQLNNKELEQRVKQRTYDLQRAYNDLTTTNEQLKAMQKQLVESEKMSQLGQLVAGVAHEINTPIGIAVTAATALMDKIDLLENDFSQGKLTKSRMETSLKYHKQCSDLIYNNLNRAATLIQTFKEVSVDQSSESRRVFNLYDYLHEVIASLLPELRSYQVQVTIEGDQSFEFDNFPGTFGQLLTNFVINSLRHGFDKNIQHSIVIKFTLDEEFIYLTYQDDGLGVSEEVLPRIFDPFYTTQRNKGGTGLGLNIVYNLVTQRLNGSITCTSVVNEGIKFSIKIPQVI
ncbi:sensor histidine kinase [Colwellia sp. 12G3]|uniref:sensor histidine kinase n=1 Tax=Colwellia sp. 12G3 TaxID=2058299 RepID=UPI000C347AE0|nr:ATP-binding protein [Colwellia sp. 12G3]PKI12883.1 hypothetical protein CXF71_19400 [Colwellia sp. 12G3]